MREADRIGMIQPVTIEKIDIHGQNMNVYKKLEDTLARREELSLSNTTVTALNEALVYFANSFIRTDQESRVHPHKYISKIDFTA